MNFLKSAAGAILACQVVVGLPAPQMTYGENTGPVGGVSAPIPTATAASGSLRGDSSLLGGVASRPPLSGGDSAVVPNPELVPGQEAPGSLGLFLDMNSVEVPQPIRGTKGATDPGPRTYEYEKLSPDLYAPPASDKGDVPNAMWPLGLSHNKLGTGDGSGWARQQNVGQLPIATQMAGVDMRLAPHAYRELHWHRSAEWALVLKGSVRVAAMDQDGHSFVDDVTAGDVWFFPSGIPHSLQALDEGTEFLLVFDDGDFSEDNTFLASEVFMRNPVSVMSKNLQADVSAFKNLPNQELFIFNGTPAPEISKQNVTSSAGPLPISNSYTYHWSQQKPYTVPGGSVKILDPVTFPVAAGFSAALVVLEPGAMRELHWHATSDEWNYFLQGSARITVFAAPSASRTFDFTAGDVGYIEKSNCHYVENTGTEDVIFLEVLQADRFTDISVAQWLALTPKQVVKDTLNLTDEVIDKIPKDKTLIKTGNRNMTALAGGGVNFKA